MLSMPYVNSVQNFQSRSSTHSRAKGPRISQPWTSLSPPMQILRRRNGRHPIPRTPTAHLRTRPRFEPVAKSFWKWCAVSVGRGGGGALTPSTIWATRDRFRQNMRLQSHAHPSVSFPDVVEPTVEVSETQPRATDVH